MAAEKNFETSVKNYLKTKGIYPFGQPKQKMKVKPTGYYEKRFGGGMYTKNGLPDMHIVIKGLSLEVEIKASNGKPSELQVKNIQQITDANCIGFILYPNDFNLFKELINKIVDNDKSYLKNDLLNKGGTYYGKQNKN